MSNQNKEELSRYVNELYQRQQTKVIKNHKGYDRSRDRKDPRLYEIEENSSDSYEKS